LSVSTTSPLTEGRFADCGPYEVAFARRVLQLIRMGHRRLCPAEYANAEEPAITGKLKCAIREALEDENSPRWVARYEVTDEVPLDAPGRSGKNRRRVDIELVRVQHGRRPRFQFEAKRLYRSSSVNAYLGTEGLGCFFAGREAYAVDHPQAGMLGYVQAETEHAWADRIGNRLASAPRASHMRANTVWETHSTPSGPTHVFSTYHDRPCFEPLTMYHAFLLFH